MNFKKTLGLVLTAALVSTSLVAVKPAKAATPVVATAPSSLTAFNYFFAQRSMLVAGEQDSYTVDTNYSGKVQYELWVKSATDSNAKWQVVSADANGKAGYTAAVDGQNSPYSIPLVSSFKFAAGQYYTAVYAKVAGTAGTKDYKHYIDANGVDTDSKTGTLQGFDIVKTGRFNAIASKGNYNEMLGDFLLTAASTSNYVTGQKITFSGFAGQKDGAKYKLVVRKVGTDASTQTVVNPTAFQTTVDWTPATAGTYELIAWSAPDVNKTGARDGWAIDSKYVTVVAAPTLTVTSAGSYNPFMGYQDVKVNDSTLVKTVTVNGAQVKFTAPDATTIRIVSSDVPTSIVFTDAAGNNVTALGGTVTPPPASTTLTVTSAGSFNPFMGFQDVKVNDSSLVKSVLVNGTAAKFSAPNATTIRLILDDEPTSIVLVDAAGNKVTAK